MDRERYRAATDGAGVAKLPMPRQFKRIAILARGAGRVPTMLAWSEGETLASDSTTIPQNGSSALARIAAEESVLPFAADFRWLILSFHKSV